MTYLLIALMIALNALYVAAEFATVAARTFRLEAMAAAGNKRAARLLPYLADVRSLDRYVAACQIGITASSLLLGAFGQGSLTAAMHRLLSGLGLEGKVLETLAAGLVLLGLTGLQVVFGELVPKAVALRFPESVALALTWPMIASLWLYAWFIKVLNGTGEFILRWLGVAAQGHRHVHSPEELERMLAHGVRAGTLERGEHDRLRRVFHFSERTLSEVMVPRTRIQGLALDSDWATVDEILSRNGYSRYPIYERDLDHIKGLVHVKDLALLPRERPPDLLRAARTIQILPGTLGLTVALERLRRAQAQMAVVLDEFGGTEGLVTMEDLVEEVVGEIHDESDPARPAREPLADGASLMRGELLLEDLAQELGLPSELPAVNTLGGLVMHLLGRRPEVGDRVELEGLELTVRETRGARIVRVEVRCRV
ncbi:MAG: membrane protein [Candidatus Xenobia bacterium]|jgi:CBS domain containing-hemolysin-like protein